MCMQFILAGLGLTKQDRLQQEALAPRLRCPKDEQYDTKIQLTLGHERKADCQHKPP